MRSTPRSVSVKHWKSSFDASGIEEAFRTATWNVLLPRVAEMERNMLNAAFNIVISTAKIEELIVVLLSIFVLQTDPSRMDDAS